MVRAALCAGSVGGDRGGLGVSVTAGLGVWIVMLVLAASSARGGLAYVEDSPVVTEMVARAEEMLGQGRASDAAALCQQVVEGYPRKLLPVSAGGSNDGVSGGDGVLWTDAREYVWGWVLGDAALREAYRQRFGATASLALESALAPDGSRAAEAALLGVFDRYRATSAGAEAGLTLAGRWLERGRAAEARALLSGLEGHPDVLRDGLRWLTLEAYAAAWGGDVAGVRAVWDRLDGDGGGGGGLSRVTEPGSVMAGSLELARWVAGRRDGTAGSDDGASDSRDSDDGGGGLASGWVDGPGRFAGHLSEPLWVLSVSGEAGVGETAIEEAWPGVQAAVPQRWVGAQRLPGDAGPRVVISGDLMLVHDGRSVSAYERHALSSVWRYEGPTDPEGAGPADANKVINVFQGRVTVSSQAASALALVARDGVAVAVLPDGGGGELQAGVGGLALRQRLMRGLASGVLAGLDAASGAVLWERDAGFVETEIVSGGDWAGEPVMGAGLVVCAVVRQQGGEYSVHVAALDARDGSLLWRRHVFSELETLRGGVPEVVSLTLEDGRVWVSGAAGVVACLEAGSGRLHWLRRVATAEGFRGVLSPPVRVGAGLVVSGLGPGRGGLLLSAEDGRLISVLDGSIWRRGAVPRRLGDDLLLLGQTLTLLEGRNLTQRWSAKLGFGETSTPIDVVPRGGVLLVSGPEGLYALDRKDGRRLARQRWPRSGTLTVVGDQLIVAGAGAVSGYLSFPSALEALGSRMSVRPGDPMPGVALAKLAYRHGRAEALVAGFDHAVSAVRLGREGVGAGLEGDGNGLGGGEDLGGGGGAGGASAGIGSWVFEALLDLLSSGEGEDGVEPEGIAVGLERALLDRLGALVSTPTEEVTYRDRLGRFLSARGDAVGAVAQYQQILDDAALRGEMLPSGALLRNAGLLAERQLRGLIAAHGRSVYRGQQLAFVSALREVEARSAEAGDVSPEALVALASRYPVAEGAARVRRLAGDAYRRRGADDLALVQYRRAYGMATRAGADWGAEGGPGQEAAVVAGRLVETLRLRYGPGRAAGWLAGVAHERPGWLIARGTGENDVERVRVSDWLAELRRAGAGFGAESGEGASAEAVTLPLRGVEPVAGTLVTPTHGSGAEAGVELGPGSGLGFGFGLGGGGVGGRVEASSLLFREGEALVCREPGDLRERWRVSMGGEDFEVLSDDGEQVLVWLPGAGGLRGFSSATGEPLWPAVDVGALMSALPEAVDDAESLAGGLAGEELDALIAVNRRAMVVNGRVVLQAPGVIRVGGAGGRAVVADGDRWLTAVGGSVVAVADGRGRVVGVDRYTGATRWVYGSSVGLAASLEAGGGGFVICGVIGGRTVAQSGRVEALDGWDGTPLLPTIEQPMPVAWAGLTHGALLVLNTANDERERRSGAVSAYRLGDAAPLWRRSLDTLEPRGGMTACLRGGVVVVRDAIGGMAALSANGGGLLCNRRANRVEASGDRVSAQALASRLNAWVRPAGGRLLVPMVDRVCALGSGSWSDSRAGQDAGGDRAMVPGPISVVWGSAVSAVDRSLRGMAVSGRRVWALYEHAEAVPGFTMDAVLDVGGGAAEEPGASDGVTVRYTLEAVDLATGRLEASYGLLGLPGRDEAADEGGGIGSAVGLRVVGGSVIVSVGSDGGGGGGGGGSAAMAILRAGGARPLVHERGVVLNAERLRILVNVPAEAQVQREEVEPPREAGRAAGEASGSSSSSRLGSGGPVRTWRLSGGR